MRKWTRRADKRPDELAAAALELCAERGVQATRVADVAEHAGVTVGTVYRYFRDKDALIDAALALAERPGHGREVPDRPGAALPALAEALRRWGTFFNEAGTRAVRVALSDPQRDAHATHTAIGAALDEIERIVAQGVARKDLRADLSARAVARALVGALVFAPALGTPDSARDGELDALTALATRGLRADGPSWRPAAS